MTRDDGPKAGKFLHLASHDKGDPVAPPLVRASMYHLPGDPQASATYGRAENPTWEVVEEALAALEDAPVVLFPSGMAAIAAALFCGVRAGARVLMPSDGYYATRVLADEFLSGLGVSVEYRPTSGFLDGGFEGYDLVFVETPSNPGLDVIEIKAVSEATHHAGGRVVVDNTTMTPFGQRPLELGADVVVASDTKAPGGHSDLLMGHLATRDAQFLERVGAWRKFSGSIPSPSDAWMLHRGLQTLEVRFDRMCTSAGVVAERLATHSKVLSVRYPGLVDDPSHALALQQMDRFGFLLHVTLQDGEVAERFIEGCPLLQPATSFGGVHSSAERRARWGDDVPDGSIRLSVGCEPVDELWDAIAKSLDAL